MSTTYTTTPLVNEHCATGENPYWRPDDGRVYWTDIPNGRIYRYDPATGAHETVYDDPGAQVGGFTLQADGDWLLFRETDIATMAADGRHVRTVLPFRDEGAKRFNDVIADPEGRVFAGTIGVTKESGGLYRIDTDGAVTKVRSGTGNGNGMGFTPDGSRFYWTDSTAKRIYRYRYDRATGELSDETVFYQGSPEEGTPDGMAVDGEGFVWSARFRGSAILKHAPDDGRVLDRITLPAAKVTSLFFGGLELETLYVTTAGGGEPDSADVDGTLFQVTLDRPVRGQHEFRSRILSD
uniref:SMP-30/Gluconolactonase/LRE-like region domain-containing protein n=1 Tax=uncultured Armatimonadetes bacterium TaxID=157466 RepID=A0A6J4GZU0_9BACT|nr:hypothetical protein AVDCRST_MAG63-1515 [uncultured Armatimonadetes bacterium]